MLRRIAVAACSLASAPMLFTKVKAAEGESNQQARKIKASQLPIYGSPKEPEYEYIPEEVGMLRQNISVVRKLVWKLMASIQGTSNQAKEKIDAGKAQTMDFFSYVQEDSGFLPRGAFIIVFGLGGAVASYRGGPIKKLMYPSIGMLTAAACCYPKEAEDIARAGWDKLKTAGQEIYSPGSTQAKNSLAKSATPQEKAAPKPEESAPSPTPAQNPPVDHGMSNPEDKDMYTTRSS